MRMKTVAALLGFLLLVPLAVAQEQEGNDQDQNSETEGKEVAPTPPAAKDGKETAPGEVHTVAKGDTLWDLSQKYLGSPWYWPKVWSYNPEIANPHWIYPGNQIRFFPSGEEVPSRVEVGNAPNEIPDEGEEGVTSTEMVTPDEETPVQGPSQLAFTPKNAMRVVHQGFVTQKEVEEAGFIASSFSEVEMLSFPETAYVKFRKKGSVKVGDRFVAFRTEDVIDHPITGARVGYLTHLIGTMKIIKVSDTYATAMVMPDCWDEVRRGDLLGPFSERLVENVTKKANEKEVKGYIVSSQVPSLTLFGEHSLVVIDKGSADGVQPGNTFTVVRRQDPTVDVETFINPSARIDNTLPEEEIGMCMAVDVKDKATMCMLTRSVRDLEQGDRVVMKTEGTGVPTASR